MPASYAYTCAPDDPCIVVNVNSIDGTNFVTRFDYTTRAQRGAGCVDPRSALTSPDSVGDAGSSQRAIVALARKMSSLAFYLLRDGRSTTRCG